MSKWLFRIVWIPILIGAVLFLVANRTPVAISLDPFRPENPALSTPSLPLWFWLMVMLFVGLGLGVAGSWLSGRDARVQARDNRRTVKALHKEVAALTARLPAEPAANEDLPKLESTDL
jgi:hypothetical protein